MTVSFVLTLVICFQITMKTTTYGLFPLCKIHHAFPSSIDLMHGFSLGSITTYGTIIPQSPLVEIGKEFTATCVLDKAAKATAEDIYWKLKNITVPKEQYTKINDSAVSVTITITNETANWLLCEKKGSPLSLNLNQVIHGILLTKGCKYASNDFTSINIRLFHIKIEQHFHAGIFLYLYFNLISE